MQHMQFFKVDRLASLEADISQMAEFVHCEAIGEDLYTPNSRLTRLKILKYSMSRNTEPLTVLTIGLFLIEVKIQT